jgi:predicted aconitase with swiveling domain
MVEFKGRVLISGEGFGTAVVTKKVVVPNRAFSISAENKSKKLIFKDKEHQAIYKKNITGKIFVAPTFKADDIHSMVLLSICKKGIAPKCFLFSQTLDETAVSAFVLCKTFLDAQITVIDSLGKDFLNTVENGDEITYTDQFVVLKF